VVKPHFLRSLKKISDANECDVAVFCYAHFEVLLFLYYPKSESSFTEEVMWNISIRARLNFAMYGLGTLLLLIAIGGFMGVRKSNQSLQTVYATDWWQLVSSIS
jgi:hypothetical protein